MKRSGKKINEAELADYVSLLVNGMRLGRNLPSLKRHEFVDAIALEHSQKMARRGLLGHDEWGDRHDQLRDTLSATAIAENIGTCKGGVEVAGGSLCKDWRNNFFHFHKLIGYYNLTGIGVAIAEDGRYFVCQIFVKN